MEPPQLFKKEQALVGFFTAGFDVWCPVQFVVECCTQVLVGFDGLYWLSLDDDAAGLRLFFLKLTTSSLVMVTFCSRKFLSHQLHHCLLVHQLSSWMIPDRDVLMQT